MRVTSVGLLINAKREDLESKLKNSSDIDDFDIEELDKADGMKDVMISFKDPVNLKYASSSLENLLKDIVKVKVYE